MQLGKQLTKLPDNAFSVRTLEIGSGIVTIILRRRMADLHLNGQEGCLGFDGLDDMGEGVFLNKE